MRWFRFVIIVAVFCFSVAEKSGDDGDAAEEGVREMRELDREGWRAVEPFSEDQSDWVPHEQRPQQGEQYPKRRRLRKRKRRPPVIDSALDGDVLTVPARRKPRPEGLEQSRHPWDDLSQESLRKPNIRRRVTPRYQSSEEVTVRNMNHPADNDDETVNETNQISSGNKEDVQPTTAPDLKTVLKQHANGLSLSEILQQKNLSLAELLMGNKEAISALTEKPNIITESSITDKTTESERDYKYKRLPPRKLVNRNYEQDVESVESLTSKGNLEAQRKRLATLQHHKDNSIFSSVTKLDVITEPTTEKRIFVPSHPKYYTSLNFKPNFNLNSDQSTESASQREETTTVTSITTTSKAQETNSTDTQLKQNRLPLTNAKIIKLKVKDKKEIGEENEPENYPPSFKFPEPIKIDITEVYGFKEKVNKTEGNTKQDTPLRMSIDLEELMEKTIDENDSENLINPKTTTEEVVTTEEPLREKLPSVTAKDEIMEILRDPISRERLSRILQDRNMTLQELVDQRERGSSQLHLADIFHNETREPEPQDEPFVGTINSDYFNSFPLFGRQQKSKSFENTYTTASSATSSTTQPAAEVRKVTTEAKVEVTSFPSIKIEVDKERIDPFRWKSLYPDPFSSVHESNYKETEEPTNAEIDILRIDDVENALSFSSKEKLNIIEENRLEDDVLINIPSGVKSAIFVSLAIVGLSILVFLTILLVFRWTQKQKTRMNYCSSLSTRLRTPIIMQKRPAHAIKTFVNETLGRRKNNYYRTNIQSMSDDMWDDCRDRKPSF